MTSLYRWILLVLLLVISLSAQSQGPTKVITGVVKDSKDSHLLLPGVTIQVKGSTTGTATDFNGAYTLEAPVNATLIFSFIGYDTREEAVNNRTQIHVSLTASAKTLDEVVVVGYGVRQRKNLTSAITSVNAEALKNVPAASIDQQLQGRAAGVQVSANSGVPGAGLNFRIRGTTSINASNDPLYVVDGVFINNETLQNIGTSGGITNPLADLNPADVESIEILKDANATAIYGARGANGVVLITTKRGSYNAKARITLNTYQGWSWPPRLWDLTTGPEHALLQNESWINSGQDNPALNRTYANRPFRPVAEGGRGLPEEQQTYDRLGKLFRTARSNNYDLAVAGGGEATKYFVGAGFTRQEAIVTPSEFQRFNFRANLDQKLSSKVNLSVSNSLSRSYRNQARLGDGPQGGMFQAALHTPTYLPEFDAAGVPLRYAGFDNLQVLIDHTDISAISNRYIGNLAADWQIVPGLRLKSSWSLDYNDYDESQYWNTLTLLGSGTVNGYGQVANTQNTIWINEQTLSYNKTFGEKHALDVVAGNTIQSNLRELMSGEGRGYPSNAFTQLASAATTTATAFSSQYGLLSFFSRAGYSYEGKYVLDASLRADASSRFGQDRRWGYFPSAGLAWNATEEPFLQHVTLLSLLKLRASIGSTGNQNGINDFASLGLWQGGANYLNTAGIAPFQLANPNLHWETTRQWNLGLDAAFFHNRLALELNYYDKYTSGLLLQVPIKGSLGYSTISSNEGAMSNKGFEVSVNTVNVSRGSFAWRSGLSGSRNINRIEKLAAPINQYNRDWVRMEQGYPMYSFWLYRQLGVDPETGNAVFADLNDDGAITAADRHIVGNAAPKFYGSFTNNLTYRGFDLGVFFNFQYGNKVFNLNRFFMESGGIRDANRSLHANQLRRWQQPGDITDVPRMTTVGNNYNLEANSRFLEDGSFLRLSNLTLGYRLPQAMSTRLKLSSARLYFTGTNLLLLSHYLDPDPEVNVAGNNANVQGLDLGTVPQPRTLQAGLNLGF